jgi:hypothetical protein
LSTVAATESARAGVIASLLLPPQTRSVGPLPTLVVGSRANGIALDLLLDASDFPRYRAALQDATTSRIVWQSSALTPSSSTHVSAVSVHVPARLLKSRSYLLQLSGVGASGSAEFVGTYAFQIVFT